MSRKTWIKTYKLIVLFYRFQSIIDSSHKSFIHNHFVSRLVFLSKRICSKAEREREREKKSFILSVFFTILPVAISLEALTLSLLLLLFEKKKDGIDGDEEEKEKKKNEKKKKRHTVRDLFDYFVTSLSMLYALVALLLLKTPAISLIFHNRISC